MAISQSDLSFKKAENNSDLSTNGGWLSNTPVTASLLPDVSGAERTAGLTRYRKIFLKNEQGLGTAPDKYVDLALLQARVFLENISPAEDRITLKAAQPADSQAQAVNYTGWAGVGYLEADVLANATTCQVRTEVAGSSGELFQIGGQAVFTNGLAREFVTLSNVTYDSTLYTLHFTTTPLINAYSRASQTQTADILTSNTIGYTLAGMTPNAYIGKRLRIKSASAGVGQVRRILSNTGTTCTLEYAWTTTPEGTIVYEILDSFVAMCVSLGDIIATYSGVSKTFAVGGTFDETKIKLFPIGTKDDQWTFLFSSPTAFTITGAKFGTIGGGTVSTDPLKISTGTSFYFEIPANAWGGTFQTGDRLVFSTSSSSKGFWIKEVVPQNAASHQANSWDLGASGDTV